jgi:hypothetical protein
VAEDAERVDEVVAHLVEVVPGAGDLGRVGAVAVVRVQEGEKVEPLCGDRSAGEQQQGGRAPPR